MGPTVSELSAITDKSAADACDCCIMTINRCQIAAKPHEAGCGSHDWISKNDVDQHVFFAKQR